MAFSRTRIFSSGTVTASMVLFLFGCAGSGLQIMTHVISFRSGTAHPGETCFIFPGNPGIAQDDLEFQEYKAWVTSILNRKGYEVVSDSRDAEMAVTLQYGVGEPTTSYVPTWGVTGYSGAATYYGYGSATTIFNPTYGINGAVPMTNFTRYIILTASENSSFKSSGSMPSDEKQLWKTSIYSSGGISDLREIFPRILAAAANDIGENDDATYVCGIDDSLDIYNRMPTPTPTPSSLPPPPTDASQVP